MQAIAWAMAGGRDRHCRRADRELLLHRRRRSARRSAIVAFVTVSLGGFGSVPGALVAGLLIGVIESLSAYLIGAGLQGHRRLHRCSCWCCGSGRKA